MDNARLSLIWYLESLFSVDPVAMKGVLYQWHDSGLRLVELPVLTFAFCSVNRDISDELWQRTVQTVEHRTKGSERFNRGVATQKNCLISLTVVASRRRGKCLRMFCVCLWGNSLNPVSAYRVKLIRVFDLWVFHFVRRMFVDAVGKPEGRKQLGRPTRRWKENIKIDLEGVGWEAMDWIDLAQHRDRWRAVVNAVMNVSVP